MNYQMINLDIRYSFDEETKQFIAEIPSLNLSDYGDTLEEAHKNLLEALKLYMEVKYGINSLDKKTDKYETV